ncbi:MAG: hypothetical protein R3C03_09400 [Pirellulaceae bacterium]
MNKEDESQFLQMLLERGDTELLVGNAFNSPSPTPANRIDLANATDVQYFTLLNKSLSQKIRNQPYDDGLFRFSMFRDAHIDFHRCQISNDLITSGRIFAKIGWLDSVKRNTLYRSWYQSIGRWIKNRYRKIESGWWIGPGAEIWSREGGKLALGGRLAKTISLAD